MSRHIIKDADFMNYIMTPPTQEEYTMNHVKVDTVRVLDRNRQVGGSLGEVAVSNSEAGGRDWMPIVIIVVSAMALLTVYAVVTKR